MERNVFNKNGSLWGWRAAEPDGSGACIGALPGMAETRFEGNAGGSIAAGRGQP
ncbi:hypothetical protein ACWJKU_06805 [Methylocaldum sp. MU1018]